mgnify:CR=1 FL=1
MKIEKLRSKLKKAFNRVMGVLLPVATLFVSCGTNALVVHAVESGQSVHIVWEYEVTGESTSLNKQVASYDTTYSCGAGYEIVACYASSSTTLKTLYITVIDKNTKSKIGVLNYGTGTYKEYHDGKLKYEYSIPKNKVPPEYIYCGNGTNTDYRVTKFSIGGNIKIFKDNDALNSYIKSGDTSGMIELDKDIDDGVKDPDIGYLHNLQMNQLQTGKQDENGIYELYSDRFTWDDTYPEYDSSYLVEVRGKCVVQTRGFLGFGKTKTYTSDIENIAKDISYKDLEWIISSQDKFAPFNSFINEHMPTNLVMTGVYGMRDLYFRIYKWSDADECYHYGPWVNMHFIDDDVWISVDGDTTLGDFDKDGNFIVNPDSDYGTGKKNDVGVGVGDTIEDAKKDNDRRNEEKKNDDGKLDLSNASISDIWYWFVTSLSNLYNSLGFIPEFFQKIFSFLPTPIYVFLGIGIVVAILLRVLGR